MTLRFSNESETYCKALIWGLTLITSSRMCAPYGPMRLRLRLSCVTSDGLLFKAPARLSRRSSVRSVFLRTSCSTSSDVFSTVIMASTYSDNPEKIMEDPVQGCHFRVWFGSRQTSVNKGRSTIDEKWCVFKIPFERIENVTPSGFDKTPSLFTDISFFHTIKDKALNAITHSKAHVLFCIRDWKMYNIYTCESRMCWRERSRWWRFSKHSGWVSRETYGLAASHVHGATLLDLEEYFRFSKRLFHCYGSKWGKGLPALITLKHHFINKQTQHSLTKHGNSEAIL